MPELPEVEAVCRKLRRDAGGSEIVAAKVLRAAATRPQRPRRIESAVAGRTIEAIERRGKNILIHLSGALALRVHLRMTGDLYVIPDVRIRPATTRVWFELGDGRGLIFDDPRMLGKVHLHCAAELAAVLGELGLEPLDGGFTAERFVDLARRSRQPAKLFLMDQTRVAGLGNIYAAEALFRAGIHPRRGIGSVSRPRLERLHTAIVEVLREAVESAVRAYARPGEFGEAEGFPVAVYGRAGEACERCGRKIRRITQGGRSTYFCPGCQR